MERASLEKLGLTKEQVDAVMTENGKDIKAEQDKAKTAQDTAVKDAVAVATKPLNETITKNAEQVKELEDKIKASGGVDEKSKKEIEELQKTHAAALKEIQDKQNEAAKEHEAALAKLRRENETREFFAGYGKKFITPETQKAFEQRINECLTDKAYEGRNRADILAIITKGEDGKERTDIYAPPDTTSKPPVTGDTTSPPGDGAPPPKKEIPIII